MALNLATLPPELLTEITDHLQPSSQISLKLVNKSLSYGTPPVAPVDYRDRCEVRAWRRFSRERENLQSDKKRCIVCDALELRRMFRDNTPICRWHDGWFIKTYLPQWAEPSMKEMYQRLARNSTTVQWFAISREFCAHRRNVIGWDSHECNCECNSCGHFEVTCYLRLAPQSDDLRSWEIFGDGEGAPCVIEQHGLNGKS